MTVLAVDVVPAGKRKRHRTENEMEGKQKCHRTEREMEDDDLNSHLLKIRTRFKFVKGYTEKGSPDFSNLESLIREIIKADLKDNKKTNFNIVKAEEINKNVSIFLEVTPHINISNIFDRMKEKCSPDRWFVYDSDTNITADKSGKKWKVETRTKHFVKTEGDILPQIRKLYQQKMADLLRQLDENIIVDVEYENITAKDGYDFVPFTVQSERISVRLLHEHLKDKCQNWNFTEIILVQREFVHASWIPINDKRHIRKEVEELLNAGVETNDIYEPKV